MTPSQLNKLAAVRVMGWKRFDEPLPHWPKPLAFEFCGDPIESHSGPWFWPNDTDENIVPFGCDVPNYSTDIADAWRLVEKMRTRTNKNGDLWRVMLISTGDRWFVEINDWDCGVDVTESDRSPELAITLAALRAVGVREEEMK